MEVVAQSLPLLAQFLQELKMLMENPCLMLY